MSNYGIIKTKINYLITLAKIYFGGVKWIILLLSAEKSMLQ